MKITESEIKKSIIKLLKKQGCHYIYAPEITPTCLRLPVRSTQTGSEEPERKRAMKYNPDIHHRRSIRLKGYDYSQAGLYFITICTQNRLHMFGEIENGEMVLNDAGNMIGKWYFELENKYPDIRCGVNSVMPNHFHAIIINNGNAASVGADLRVCPNSCVYPNSLPDSLPNSRVCPDGTRQTSENGQSHRIAPTDTANSGEHKNLGEHDNSGEHVNLGEHIGSPLPGVVRWFKTMSTNEYIRGVKQFGWQPFDRKLWQRNYYEHIIRDEKSYCRISEYIQTNALKWQDDKYYV